jgi:hypothetical protein
MVALTTLKKVTKGTSVAYSRLKIVSEKGD